MFSMKHTVIILLLASRTTSTSNSSQPKIDSIYKHGAKSLINQYFEEGIPKLYLEYEETDSIPSNRLMELEYAITVLIRDGYKVFSDCETGIPMLAVKK